MEPVLGKSNVEQIINAIRRIEIIGQQSRTNKAIGDSMTHKPVLPNCMFESALKS